MPMARAKVGLHRTPEHTAEGFVARRARLSWPAADEQQPSHSETQVEVKFNLRVVCEVRRTVLGKPSGGARAFIKRY